MHAVRNQLHRRAHVHDLRPTGIADGAGSAHEQDTTRVYVERGIVDPGVIIFRAVENDGPAFERVGVLRIGKDSARENSRLEITLSSS